MDRIFRIMAYFKRGHTAYFSFFIQVINFFNLFYVLLITLGVVEASLTNYILFTFFMTCSYVPFAIFLGRWDYNEGAFIVQSEIVKEKSPIYQGIFQQLNRIERKLSEK